MALRDRQTADGRVVRAVAGFDATFSAPKSVSVWWALTGDPRPARRPRRRGRRGARAPGAVRGDDPDPVTTAAGCIPTRLGLTMATFRQTTSRADDPQLHTHAVISAKVQTVDGRWLALDARFLKRHQRMLGGLYQSVLRAELTHRYGITWEPIVNGQAEITGVPPSCWRCSRSAPSRSTPPWPARSTSSEPGRAGIRPGGSGRPWNARPPPTPARRKTGRPVADLQHRWRDEARELGWTAERLTEGLTGPARERRRAPAGDRRAGPRSALHCRAPPGPGPTCSGPCATWRPPPAGAVGTGVGGRRSNASPARCSPSA